MDVKNGIKIVAVDFDGTLCENKFPKIGKPKPAVINFVKSLSPFVTLILHTCRTKELLADAVEWCRKRGIVFDFINENDPRQVDKYGGDTRKISADLYIDDKAINVAMLEER